jgi:prepilin-type processing-associated H-X9-DG protein
MVMPILVTCECGKQFQAKAENVGRRFNCPDCGREVVVPKPDANSYFDAPVSPIAVEAKTSGMAITSLVLGILSMVGCVFFTGIPAIIFGALGLGSINKPERRLGGKGLAIAGIVTGTIGTVMSVLFLAALLLPAIQAAREAARRAQCVNNLKQIGLALHNYESSYGCFPPEYTTDANGKPLLSWRVLILPYLEQSPLYGQFKQDEPWDGPTNIKLLDQMPKMFTCPSEPAGTPPAKLTHYLGITGGPTLFEGPEGVKVQQITDGTSNTLAVVESNAAIEWTKPGDVDASQIPGALGSKHPGGLNGLFVDGSVKFLKKTLTPVVLKAMTTRDGGEVITNDTF